MKRAKYKINNNNNNNSKFSLLNVCTEGEGCLLLVATGVEANTRIFHSREKCGM